MSLPDPTFLTLTRRLIASASFLALLIVASCVSGCRPFAFARVLRFGGSADHLESAEELSRQGKTDEAITHYRAHIEERLAVADRPEWENPYFYLLLIGDLQLNNGQPDAALATYEEAEQQKVHASLVSDRYRSVARWYETQGRLTEAAALLQRYRTRDELLFDSMLDRISKQIVQNEERAATPPPPSPSPSPCPECVVPTGSPAATAAPSPAFAVEPQPLE